MDFKVTGVYKITNPEGGVYIGQSVNIQYRISDHRRMRGCEKYTPKLYKSFIKFGIDNHVFEVLEVCKREELKERERHYQDLYNATGGDNLNCILTATKDKKGVGVSPSEEIRKAVGDFHRGKVYSEETKAKIRYARARQIITDEHKRKISDNSASARIVVNIESGIFYNSAKEAAIAHGMKHNTLVGLLLGRNRNKTNLLYV